MAIYINELIQKSKHLAIYHYEARWSHYRIVLIDTVLNLFVIFCRLFDSVDKIQIRTVFMFQFKLGQKATWYQWCVLAQEPLTNVCHHGGSRNFAMVRRASKMKTVAAGRLRLITNIESINWSWSLQNHTRSCWNRGRPLNSRSPFKANREVKKVG